MHVLDVIAYINKTLLYFDLNFNQLVSKEYERLMHESNETYVAKHKSIHIWMIHSSPSIAFWFQRTTLLIKHIHYCENIIVMISMEAKTVHLCCGWWWVACTEYKLADLLSKKGKPNAYWLDLARISIMIDLFNVITITNNDNGFTIFSLFK